MTRETAVVVKEGLEQINNIDFTIFEQILKKGWDNKNSGPEAMRFAKHAWGIFSGNPYKWFIIIDENMKLAFTEKLMQLREQSKTKQG